MTVIKVPKTPKKSFNKNRPASVLLLGQIEHLEWAVLPASRRNLRTRKQEVKTEGQAAERVAQLLAIMPKPGEVPPMRLPPLPRVEEPARRSGSRAPGGRRRTAKKPSKKRSHSKKRSKRTSTTARKTKKKAGTRAGARRRRR